MKRIATAFAIAAMMASPVLASETDLEQRIADLEKRVEVLEQMAGITATEEFFSGFEVDAEVSEDSYTADGFTYTYVNTEAKNIGGSDYAIVYFNFTNNSGNASSALNALGVIAFQNGVSTNMYVLTDDSIPELQALTSQIQDGITLPVAYAFAITDKSDITIEIHPRMTTNETPVWEKTVSLQ